MLRDQAINFLEALVVFLLLTNAVSIMVTAYAMRLIGGSRLKPVAMSAVERKLEAMISRTT